MLTLAELSYMQVCDINKGALHYTERHRVSTSEELHIFRAVLQGS